eukprot:5322377-Amphidinium_carterae.1
MVYASRGELMDAATCLTNLALPQPRPQMSRSRSMIKGRAHRDHVCTNGTDIARANNPHAPAKQRRPRSGHDLELQLPASALSTVQARPSNSAHEHSCAR